MEYWGARCDVKWMAALERFDNSAALAQANYGAGRCPVFAIRARRSWCSRYDAIAGVSTRFAIQVSSVESCPKLPPRSRCREEIGALCIPWRDDVTAEVSIRCSIQVSGVEPCPKLVPKSRCREEIEALRFPWRDDATAEVLIRRSIQDSCVAPRPKLVPRSRCRGSSLRSLARRRHCRGFDSLVDPSFGRRPAPKTCP